MLPGLNGTEGLFASLKDRTPEKFKPLCITYPTHEKRSYQELASYVLDELSKIEGNYLLLGESFSGPIAILASASKPKGLLGIILVATFIYPPNLQPMRFLPWSFIFSMAHFVYKLKKLIKSTGKPDSIFDAALIEVQKSSPVVLADRIKEIFQVNVKSALENCHLPLAYFRGKKDFIVPERNLHNILTTKLDTIVTKFNTGHFLLQSDPAAAWDAISEFESQVGWR